MPDHVGHAVLGVDADDDLLEVLVGRHVAMLAVEIGTGGDQENGQSAQA